MNTDSEDQNQFASGMQMPAITSLPIRVRPHYYGEVMGLAVTKTGRERSPLRAAGSRWKHGKSRRAGDCAPYLQSRVQHFIVAICFTFIAGCGTDESDGRRPSFGNAASTKPTIASPKPTPPFQAPKGLRRPVIDLSESVGIVGPVRQRVVSWEEGMTVASALLTAEYLGRGNPREIYINRGGVTIPVNVRKLLRNLQNPPLQAGDILEIRP